MTAVGDRFGRLVAVEQVKGALWRFRCDCGTEIDRQQWLVRSGNTKSCGCWNLDRIRAPRTSGMSGTRIYNAWHAMVRRCTDPKVNNYENYGGRGIRVSNRWLKFENFYADVGDRPPGTSLERKDNDGNYEPDNCVWATRAEQNRNTRRNVRVTLDGRTMILKDWCATLGLKYATISMRVQRGMDPAHALQLPVGGAS